MYFAVWASDETGMGETRQKLRPAHRARLRDPGDHPVRVVLGGPTLTESDGEMNGSLLIIEADSIASVRAFVADDPYVRAGVYASCEIRPWHCGLGSLAVSNSESPSGSPNLSPNPPPR